MSGCRALVAIVVVAHGAGCKTSAKQTVEKVYKAANQSDVNEMQTFFVGPQLLGQLVDCGRSSESEWLHPQARREWMRQLRLSVQNEFWRGGQSVRLVSLTRADTEPVTYQPGDALSAGCQAKTEMVIEEYQLTAELTSKIGDTRELSKPLSVWRVDKAYYLWSDPFH